MDGSEYQKVNSYISGLMEKIQKPAAGLFEYPSLTTTAGNFYSACIFTWDTHHMTLRFAMDGKAEYMKYFLHIMLKFQRSNGFVPCTCNSVDGGGCNERFHAQPYLAQNAAVYLNLTGDIKTVSQLYPLLEKYLAYWLNNFAAPFGLFRWGETWMSGFDNEIAGTLYPIGDVLPPDLPSLLYLECRAMGFISRKLGLDDSFYEKRSEEIKNAVNEYLWDDEMEIYSAFNLVENRIMTSLIDDHLSNIGRFAYVSCPSLMTLFSGVAQPDRAKKMIEKYVLSPEHFRSPFGIRSLSKSSEYYNNARWGNPPRFGDWHRLTNSNWQGPVWIPINWFVFHGLLRYGFRDEALALADDTVRLVSKSLDAIGCMRENFNAETGEPLYADDFASWNILADKFHTYIEGRGLSIFPWEAE